MNPAYRFGFALAKHGAFDPARLGIPGLEYSPHPYGGGGIATLTDPTNPKLHLRHQVSEPGVNFEIAHQGEDAAYADLGGRLKALADREFTQDREWEAKVRGWKHPRLQSAWRLGLPTGVAMGLAAMPVGAMIGGLRGAGKGLLWGSALGSLIGGIGGASEPFVARNPEAHHTIDTNWDNSVQELGYSPMENGFLEFPELHYGYYA